MQGKVDSISKSKSGKTWRVKIGGQYYGANFDSNLDSAVGKPIDFIFEDGEFGKWVKSWGYAGSSPTPSPAQQKVADRPVEVSQDRFWLNFVSNCVGQAIASKTITTPEQIKPWAEFAYRAVTGLKPGWTPQNPQGEQNGPDF